MAKKTTKDQAMDELRRASLKNPNVHPARRRRPQPTQIEEVEELEAVEVSEVEAPDQSQEAAETNDDSAVVETEIKESQSDLAGEDAKRETSSLVDDESVASSGDKEEIAETQVEAKEPEDEVDAATQAVPKEETKLKLKPAPKSKKKKNSGAKNSKDISDTTEVLQDLVAGNQTPAVRRIETGKAVLSLVDVVKSYGQGEAKMEVLRGTNLHIGKGQIVGLIGPSGSGKSTLLQITGLLDNPTSGQIKIAGQAAQSLGDHELTKLRRLTVGFVYQFHHLLKEFSALENVMIPQQLAGKSSVEARVRAESLLEEMGLGHRLHHRPAKLSGGEQQRVAIARALANRPTLLLADEPTGNLDPETAETVFQLLIRVTRQEGMAALIATHNLELGARMDRVVKLDQGLLHEQ